MRRDTQQSSSLFSHSSSVTSSSDEDAHGMSPHMQKNRPRSRRRRRRARDPYGWSLSYESASQSRLCSVNEHQVPLAFVEYDHHALWPMSQPWLELSTTSKQMERIIPRCPCFVSRKWNPAERVINRRHRWLSAQLTNGTIDPSFHARVFGITGSNGE